MESALNILWLLVVLTSLGVWSRLADTSTDRRRHQSLRRLLTLCYTLVLLFPVISMTDDLHGEQAAYEEPPTTRALLKAVNDGHDSSHSEKSHSLPALTAAPAADPYLESSLSLVLNPSLLTPCHIRIAPRFGRAPPSH